MERVTVVRVAALYVPLCLAAIAWLVVAPASRARAAAFLATVWNLPALLIVHVVARRLGWWSLAPVDGTLAGFPVDLWLGWAVLWGALPALVAPRVSMWMVVIAAAALDMVAMPLLSPVVRLADTWVIGEVVAILICLVPAQWLSRWTTSDTRVGARASLQAAAFTGVVLGILPQVILERTGGSWAPLVARPRWLIALLLQVVAAVGLVGVSAVQEFAVRGRGTPVPFDPPKQLVASGPYAYVRNPMQCSAAVVMLGWGALLESWWVAAAGVMAVVYGVGFAGGDERADLGRRLGLQWRAYARLVPVWLPRWTPVDPADIASTVAALGDVPSGTAPTARATLYVAEECGPCSQVRAWFERRGVVGLDIRAAERHPMRTLDRITYDPGDGSGDSEGVAAMARALEHVNLGWAMLGMFLRLPGVTAFLQVVTDASGGGQRRVVRYCDRAEPPQIALKSSNG